MNATEQKAYQWLLKFGCKEIKFNSRSSPDFLTDKGNFEVKRVVGRSITFSMRQRKKLADTNSTTLIFDDVHDEPIATISSSDLAAGNMHGFSIYEIAVFRLKEDTHNRILLYLVKLIKRKQNPFLNMDDALNDLLDNYYCLTGEKEFEEKG